jgi:hypothetical protein
MLCIPLALSVILTLTIINHLDAAERQLAHVVYFKLKDSSPDAKEKLVVACNKYLAGHEGTVFFAVGVLAEELNREVNDRDFDISLNVVFESKAAHDKYQTHERHLQFIEENKASWAKVRVFDSYLVGGQGAARGEGRPVERREGRPTQRRDEPQAERVSLPDAAANFAGMIVAKVVAKREGHMLVHVEKVAKTWEHSRAKDPQSLVNKRVQVNAGEGGNIAKFLRTVEVGELVELDVAHKRGEALTLLELTPEQRARVK